MSDEKNNTGTDNSGYYNSGYYNSGYYNSGDYNSGDYNSGCCNSGCCNSGSYNSGSYNSGSYNSGEDNSGYCNSGKGNSGKGNSGKGNSGDRNSGSYNSGSYNSGDRNSGDYNSGDRNSGYFNTNTPTIRLFNIDTGKTREELDIPCIHIRIATWVPESEMSDVQKAGDPNYHVSGGTLITHTYKEAWAIAWADAAGDLRQQFLDLPNFDADIFFEITGVDVRKSDTCAGKIVEIEGKKYKLVEA